MRLMAWRHVDSTHSGRSGWARTRRAAFAGAASIITAATVVLTACSSGGGAQGGAASSPGSSGQAQASGELTVWHYFSDPNQVKLMTDYADLFEKNNPGVKVQNVYVPYDQMDSKLIASAGAKSGPDVVVFNGADTDNLALANTLLPLDKYWDGFDDKDKFPSSVVHKVDGKIYSAQGYVNLLGLWYNKDILDKIGVKPPTTVAELTDDMAKAVKAGFGGITLCGLPQSQGEWQAYPWLTDAGFSYSDPSAETLMKGFSTAQTWVEKGYLSKEATTWDQTVPFQKFAAGNIAFAENGNWQIATAKSTAKFKYGVVQLPLSSTGKVYLGGEGEGIGAFSKNPDLAWKYLEQTYFDQSAQLIALKDVGSIPSRTDSSKDQAVTSNELLKPFADSLAQHGANYPAEAVQPKSVNDLQLAVGQAWSAVLGGQETPMNAASSLMQKLPPMLSK